jgi:hypothetical protein
MAYAINIGINQYLTLDTPLTPASLSEFDISFRFKISSTTPNDINILYWHDNSNYLYYRVSNAIFYWKFSGSSKKLAVPKEAVLGKVLEVSLIQDNTGSKTVAVRSLGLVSTPWTIERQTTISSFGNKQTNNDWVSQVALENVTYYGDLSRTTKVAEWDVSTSPRGTGIPTIQESVGGNNATGVGFANDGSDWVDLDAVVPVSITLQPIDVEVLEGESWSLSTTAVEAISSEWYKGGVATGVTTDSISGTGLLSENGVYFNRYTNVGGDVDTSSAKVTVTTPITEILSTTDIKAGELFTITTNTVNDLTTITTLTATFGSITLTGKTGITSNTVTFLAPTGDLEVGSTQTLVLSVDATSSTIDKVFLPPTGFSVVTLTSIDSTSWISGAPYTGNSGGGAENISIGDQLVYESVTKEDNTSVVITSAAVVTLPDAVDDGVVGTQTLSWYYVEAQDSYKRSNTAVLSLLPPANDSLVTITVTGIPDGTYATALFLSDGTLVSTESRTYLNEVCSFRVAVPIGTRLKGYVEDNITPSVAAAYLEQVTA